jgi:hypothetical protein
MAAQSADGRWRDPDSNRGHHDFQATRLNHRTTRKPLQSFVSQRPRPGRTLLGIASDWTLFGPRMPDHGPIGPLVGRAGMDHASWEPIEDILQRRSVSHRLPPLAGHDESAFASSELRSLPTLSASAEPRLARRGPYEETVCRPDTATKPSRLTFRWRRSSTVSGCPPVAGTSFVKPVVVADGEFSTTTPPGQCGLHQACTAGPSRRYSARTASSVMPSEPDTRRSSARAITSRALCAQRKAAAALGGFAARAPTRRTSAST